jgi:NADPH:quinone reductase-like Zn-dependent oxidoreductase
MVKIITASEPWWEPGTQYGDHESMTAFVSAHRIHPVVDSVFRFSETIDAYRHLASNPTSARG